MWLYLEIRSLNKKLSQNEVARWALTEYDWFPYKKRLLGHRHTQKEDLLKIQRTWPSARQGEMSEDTKPDDAEILELWPPEFEKVHFSCLSHPICGPLSQQP